MSNKRFYILVSILIIVIVAISILIIYLVSMLNNQQNNVTDNLLSAPISTKVTIPPTGDHYNFSLEEKICSVEASPDGLESNTQIQNCIELCSESSTLCEVVLKAGTYNLLQGLELKDNVHLKSELLERDGVVLNRASATMGPILSMINISNVVIESITLNGQKHPYQVDIPLNNVNVLVEECSDCKIYRVSSLNAQLSSINVVSGNNIVIEDNYINNNGLYFNETGMRKSDGLSLHAVTGNSKVSFNYFENNTDINLILGGGSKGKLEVSNNTIAENNMMDPLGEMEFNSGAGFYFDTIPSWSNLCINSEDIHACGGDFSAVEFKNNINNCGRNCVFGLGIGSGSNDNWGYPTDSYSKAVLATHLDIDESNVMDKVTINSTGEGSLINPISNFCRYSSDSISGTYNNSKCTQCLGKQYENDGDTTTVSGGLMCDFYYDSGFRP